MRETLKNVVLNLKKETLGNKVNTVFRWRYVIRNNMYRVVWGVVNFYSAFAEIKRNLLLNFE